MKMLMTVFVFLFLSIDALAVDNMGILLECRPDAKFRGNVSSLRNYSGNDFPNQIEWDACEIAVNLELAKTLKKNLVKAEGLALMQAQIPGIDSFEKAGVVVQIMTSILQAAWDLTPEMTIVKEVWQSGSSMISEINALSTEQQINDYVIDWS